MIKVPTTKLRESLTNYNLNKCVKVSALSSAIKERKKRGKGGNFYTKNMEVIQDDNIAKAANDQISPLKRINPNSGQEENAPSTAKRKMEFSPQIIILEDLRLNDMVRIDDSNPKYVKIITQQLPSAKPIPENQSIPEKQLIPEKQPIPENQPILENQPIPTKQIVPEKLPASSSKLGKIVLNLESH